MNRMYYLTAVNERTGNKVYLTTKAFSHQECVTMKNRFSQHPSRRIQLEDAYIREGEVLNVTDT